MLTSAKMSDWLVSVQSALLKGAMFVHFPKTSKPQEQWALKPVLDSGQKWNNTLRARAKKDFSYRLTLWKRRL